MAPDAPREGTMSDILDVAPVAMDVAPLAVDLAGEGEIWERRRG
jgi:hypothetical protein